MPTTGISYAIVDVFATGLFTGNQAAVVITPEPLAQEVMQNIASYAALLHPLRTNMSAHRFVASSISP
jgi:hypothetical protein